jgi:spore germination protein
MLSRREVLCFMLGAGLTLPLAVLGIKPIRLGSKSSRLQAWGYFPSWMEDSWKTLDLSVWNRIILFELPVSSAGDVTPLDYKYHNWRAVTSAVHDLGGKFDVAFTLMDEKIFHAVFQDEQAWQRLSANIFESGKQAGISGVHLDFEIYGSVSSQADAGFQRFIGSLSNKLHSLPHQITLSVFLPMGTRNQLFRETTLSHVDHIVVQGYDAHWAGSTNAGPVAPLRGPHPLTWEKSLHRVLALGVPRTKVLFSIPYYGYEWQVSSGNQGASTIGPGITVSYAPVHADLLPDIRVSVLERVSLYGVKRDPESGSPYYVYRTAQGHWYQGWFEDNISLAAKLDFIKREKLCGVAAFPLGYDAGNFDALLQEKV